MWTAALQRGTGHAASKVQRLWTAQSLWDQLRPGLGRQALAKSSKDSALLVMEGACPPPLAGRTIQGDPGGQDVYGMRGTIRVASGPMSAIAQRLGLTDRI